ncbi:hypothetical protein, partial [Mesorhizobium sp.]|uniref:hypothetical protein n=1 Tax=Mesorhizobium sp. TaxID=1871066 RepID=UPI002580C985
ISKVCDLPLKLAAEKLSTVAADRLPTCQDRGARLKTKKPGARPGSSKAAQHQPQLTLTLPAA